MPEKLEADPVSAGMGSQAIAIPGRRNSSSTVLQADPDDSPLSAQERSQKSDLPVRQGSGGTLRIKSNFRPSSAQEKSHCIAIPARHDSNSSESDFRPASTGDVHYTSAVTAKGNSSGQLHESPKLRPASAEDRYNSYGTSTSHGRTRGVLQDSLKLKPQSADGRSYTVSIRRCLPDDADQGAPLMCRSSATSDRQSISQHLTRSSYSQLEPNEEEQSDEQELLISHKASPFKQPDHSHGLSGSLQRGLQSCKRARRQVMSRL